MINEFYGLTIDPFHLSPDVRFCYRHRNFARAKAYMHYALHRGEGFVMVTGKPGTGKTTLIEDLLSESATSSVNIARIASTQVAADDLLHLLADAFGIDTRSMPKSMVLLNLQSLLERQMHKGRNSLLIVDEAQNLPFESMEELRMITNLQEGASPLLQVILVGQDKLRSIIAESRMEQLRQRILAAYRMEPLNPDETRDYLHHRLLCAGWRGSPTISGEAVWLLHSSSGGIPRAINLLASRLLLYGSLEEKKDLDADDVRLVVGEMQDELLFASSASEKHSLADEAEAKPTPDFRDLAITAPSPTEITEAPAPAEKAASMVCAEPTVPESAVVLIQEVPAAATVESAPETEGIPEEREPGARADPWKAVEPTSPELVSNGTPAPPGPVTQPGPAPPEDAASVRAPGPAPSAMSQDRVETHPPRLAAPAVTRRRRKGAWVAVAVGLAALSILGILAVQPGPAIERLASLGEALRSAADDIWSFAEAPNAPDAGAAPRPVAEVSAQAREVDAVPTDVPLLPDGAGSMADSAQSISSPSAPEAETDLRPESSPLVFEDVPSVLFPEPHALSPAIAFWSRVYTEIDSASGFVHDSEKPDLVYGTLHLNPDAPPEAQKRAIEKTLGEYRDALLTLASGDRRTPDLFDNQDARAWSEQESEDELKAAAERLRFQRGQSDRVLAGLRRFEHWKAKIQAILQEQGLPPELAALPLVESSYDPQAVSKAGAVGLWQLMPATARRYLRVDDQIDERLDPIKSSEAAALLLQHDYSVLKSWPLAITAYNHGLSGVRRAVRVTGTDNLGEIARAYETERFGFASRNFYAAFLAAVKVSSHPSRYFPEYPQEGDIEQDAPVEPLQAQLASDSCRGKVADGEANNPTDSNERNAETATLFAEAQTDLAADPLDYTVAADGTIEIQVGETLGHYADWLQLGSERIKRLNNLEGKSSLILGHRLRLDFSNTSIGSFEKKRISFHKSLQLRYLDRHRIKGIIEHQVIAGDSLWLLAVQQYGVPLWLLRQYNPDIGGDTLLSVGSIMLVPSVEVLPDEPDCVLAPASPISCLLSVSP